MSLCERFKIDTKGMIASYREFFSDPRNTPSLIEERLLKGLLQIVPMRGAEAERGFSQMNTICLKCSCSMSVSHLSSLMFISINGPPAQFWEAISAVQQWLKHHKSAENNQTRKKKQIKEADLTPLQQFFCQVKS